MSDTSLEAYGPSLEAYGWSPFFARAFGRKQGALYKRIQQEKDERGRR